MFDHRHSEDQVINSLEKKVENGEVEIFFQCFSNDLNPFDDIEKCFWDGH